MNYAPHPILLIIRKAAVAMKHLRVFHSVFQLDPGLARPETTVSVFCREREGLFAKGYQRRRI